MNLLLYVQNKNKEIIKRNFLLLAHILVFGVYFVILKSFCVYYPRIDTSTSIRLLYFESAIPFRIVVEDG